MEKNLQKHTLYLFKGDYERLKSLFPTTGAATAIRRLVRNYLREVETRSGKVDLDVKEIKL